MCAYAFVYIFFLLSGSMFTHFVFERWREIEKNEVKEICVRVHKVGGIDLYAKSAEHFRPKRF